MGMRAFDPWDFELGAHKRKTKWSEKAAVVVLRRVAAGETLRQVSADADMPARTTVNYWMQTRPEFRRAFYAARAEAGKAGLGWTHGYSVWAQEEICQRLADGESLTSICRDAWMPSRHTVYRWADQLPDFRRAMRVAREAQAGGLAERGWTMALSATRDDAYLAHVQLTHLRWYVGRLGPQQFGGVKAEETEAAREARLAEEAAQRAARLAEAEAARAAAAEAAEAAKAPKRVIFRVRDFRVEMDEAKGRQRTVDVEHDWKTGELRRRDRGPWGPLLESMRGMSCVIPWDGVEGCEPDPEGDE